MKPLATSLPTAGPAAKLAFADHDTACARSGARLTLALALALRSGDVHISTSDSYRATNLSGKGTTSGIFITTVAQAGH